MNYRYVIRGTGRSRGGRQPSYIEPASPWEKPFVESFNGRVRDELLNVEEFGSLTEATAIVEAWRIEYNVYRPHSALDGLTPPSTPGSGPTNTSQHSHDS